MNPAEVHFLLVDAGASIHRYVRDGKTPLDHPGPSCFRRMLEDLALHARRCPMARAVLVFDGGRGWRSEVYPNYKAHRVDDGYRNAFVLAARYVESRLTALGAPFVLASDVEADDILSIMAGHASDARVPAMIVTDDGDLHQCLSSTVCVYRPRTGEVLTADAALGRWYGSVLYYRAWKALTGDASDNLPGVSGIGEDRADKLVAHLHASSACDYGAVKDVLFWDSSTERVFGKSAWFKRLRSAEGVEQFERMFVLVSTARVFDDLCPPELAREGGWWLVPGGAQCAVESAYVALAEPRPVPDAWSALRREADLWNIAESDILRVLSFVPPSPYGSVPRLVFPTPVPSAR